MEKLIAKQDELELMAEGKFDRLKVLIKHICEEQKVAQKLIAKQDELELMAEGKFESLRVLEGWRYNIFGKLALKLINGKVSLKIIDNKIFISHED